jgi:hypothetical protein
MNNKMIKLLAVVGGLLLMSPFAFAGSEPTPSTINDLRPALKRISLTIVPAAVECGGNAESCVTGDITIIGKCRGINISVTLADEPLVRWGLEITTEDIRAITEEGLEGRELPLMGTFLYEEVPALQWDPLLGERASKCPVVDYIGNFRFGRVYEIRKVWSFVNLNGMISALVDFVPRE